MTARIHTTVDQATHRYTIAVYLDDRPQYLRVATSGTVLRIRNRLCAEWSNRVSNVEANAIPPVFTLRGPRDPDGGGQK